MLESILKDYNATEVKALDLYADMFHFGEGYIQNFNKESRDFKANPLGCIINAEALKGKYRILFEDTFPEVLKELQEKDFAITNGITYFGRKNLLANASKMFALIFDIDGVTDSTLNNFLYGAFSKEEIYPIPNYIALSGSGIHLYYLLEEPLPLYPNIKIQLKELKFALTERLWNQYTSTQENKQYQGINQGFRVIGGKTKEGSQNKRVKAYKLRENKYYIEEFNSYVSEEHRIDTSKLYKESKMTIEEAKRKYPEWYQKRVINKEPVGHWICKRDLYEWWKRKIKEGAVYGHRYFCIMCLAIYGVKCGVSEKEVKKDAYDLIPFMNTLSPENPFTKLDVKSALECYDEKYIRYSIKNLQRYSGIEITPNKRNGRKQKTHLKIARATLEVLNDEKGKAKQGRKSKEHIVKEWRANNFTKSKAECIRETGLSKMTVYKYWNL